MPFTRPASYNASQWEVPVTEPEFGQQETAQQEEWPAANYPAEGEQEWNEEWAAAGEEAEWIPE